MEPPGAVDLLPSREKEFTGSWIVASLPASATGGGGAGFTVMITMSEDDWLRLSVTVNLNS